MNGAEGNVEGGVKFWPKLHTQGTSTPPDIVETRSEHSDNLSTDSNWEIVTFESEAGIDDNRMAKMEFDRGSPTALHRCMSTPALTEDTPQDSSYILDCSSSISARSTLTETSQNDTVLLTRKEKHMKKIPSFKDIILLNAKEHEKEEREKRAQIRSKQEKAIKDRLKRKVKPKLVISPITRCTKSTGDLSSLISIREHETHSIFDSNKNTIDEDEILGETDAKEFYHRKSKGRSNRSNGLKIRPDEAKRKQMIMEKKSMQRSSQS